MKNFFSFSPPILKWDLCYLNIFNKNVYIYIYINIYMKIILDNKMMISYLLHFTFIFLISMFEKILKYIMVFKNVII